MRILHLDRDEAFRRDFQARLAREASQRWYITEAGQLEDAERAVAEARFDVVLCDPRGMGDDLDTARHLARLFSATPLIVFSDVHAGRDSLQLVQAGVHDCLFKVEASAGWIETRLQFAVERQRRQANRAAPPDPRMTPTAAALADAAAVGAAAAARTPVPFGLATHAGAPGEWADDAREVLNRVDGAAPLRVLHVEDDPGYRRLVKAVLERGDFPPVTIQSAEDLHTARHILREQTWDVVLVDLSLPDANGRATLEGILAAARQATVIVLSGRDDGFFAIEGLRVGAEDYLVKSEPNLRYLNRAVHLGVSRHRRWQAAAHGPTRDAIATPAGDAYPAWAVAPVPPAEQRRHARYLLHRPVFAIPILPDGAPAEAYSAEGFSIDVSQGGMKFEVAGLERLPTRFLLVGVESNDAVLHFATVEVLHSTATEIGIRIGGRFADEPRDVLKPGNLEPTFNFQTKRFATGLPGDVLAKWTEFGILRPQLFDRVLVCPQCQALPTFRNGCRSCGSVRLFSQQLIHHFACAHVGYAGDFDHDNVIICPKCRTKNLIVGADFEYLNGPYRCLDCDWSDTEIDVVSQCLGCELRFPMHQALEIDLIGYHVHRLDPLAFLDDA